MLKRDYRDLENLSHVTDIDRIFKTAYELISVFLHLFRAFDAKTVFLLFINH